jgi:hypothetical protein
MSYSYNWNRNSGESSSPQQACSARSLICPVESFGDRVN